MATARLSNNGYLMLAKEATTGTAVSPAIGVPLYDESLSTNGNFQDLKPVYGNKFATHSTVPGVRSHTGDLTVMFEPNTAAHFTNGLLTAGTSTNAAGVYTYPFTLGADSASYTIDESMGNIVKRFIGVKFSKASPDVKDNEWQLKVSASALSSFEGRTIASVSGTGPYTIVLDDPNGVFDGNPTKGLIVGDAVRFFDLATNASVCDSTVTSITNGTTFVITTLVSGAMTAVGAGDVVHLRPVSPVYNNLQPFLWSKTKFCFGATASAALSATHTPLDPGTKWEIMHDFADADGAKRSGSFDPNSLDRTTGDVNFTVKKITDTPEDLANFKTMNKTACVVRMYAGSTNQYEYRLTINQLVTDQPLGSIKSGDLVMSEIKYHTNYNQTDSQGFDVKALAAITTL